MFSNGLLDCFTMAAESFAAWVLFLGGRVFNVMEPMNGILMAELISIAITVVIRREVFETCDNKRDPTVLIRPF